MSKAVCVLTNVSNKRIRGHITFEEIRKSKRFSKLKITVNVTGLTPGRHGFHIHNTGDLRKGCSSLCSHFNPDNTKHGDIADSKQHRHAGDLGNILADQNGNAQYTIYDKVIRLHGKYNIIGRSVVIHSGRDDLGLGGLDKDGNIVDKKKHLESQKTGNAGSRIACGVIGIA